MPDTTKEHWYRYEDRRRSYSSFDHNGEYVGSHAHYVEIVLCTFEVLKYTPKGIWLDNWGQRKFVLKEATKRWACATEAEARVSFLARKRKQLRIYQSRAQDVKDAIIAFNRRFEHEVKSESENSVTNQIHT